MSAPSIKLAGLGVVFVGKFAPSIFQPAWFAAKQLIPQVEADLAKIELINGEFCIFKTEWLNLTVTNDRFCASTTKEDSYPLIRDLVQGTFQNLAETPVTALGINREFNFAIESTEKWHALGHKLAPKEPWSGLLEAPGMLTVKMQGKQLPDYKGNINVTVNPISNIANGVHVQINDHYEFTEATTPESAVATLLAQFTGSISRSAKIAENLVKI